MKLHLEPTTRLWAIGGVPCRLWKGTTDDNVPVHAFVLAVSPQTHDTEVNQRFERELLPVPELTHQETLGTPDYDYDGAFGGIGP